MSISSQYLNDFDEYGIITICYQDNINLYHDSCMSNNDPLLSELIKAANHLLGTFEPGLLWDWLSDQLKNRPPSEDKDGNNKLFVPSSPPEFEEILSLTDFLLEIVSFVSFILPASFFRRI